MASESGTFKAGRELIRRLRGVNPAVFRAFLGERQYLRPRAGIGEVLSEAKESLSVCPSAVTQTLVAMKMESETAIGRLRGTDLDRMARYLHRFTRQVNRRSPTTRRGRTECRTEKMGKRAE